MKRTNWTLATPEVRTRALRYCKGEYQSNIVRGTESMSGSTLVGLASRFGGKYRKSRTNLLFRLRDNGFSCTMVIADHGAKLLKIQNNTTIVGQFRTETPPNGYKLVLRHCDPDGRSDIVLCQKNESWVTWRHNIMTGGYSIGNYFPSGGYGNDAERYARIDFFYRSQTTEETLQG